LCTQKKQNKTNVRLFIFVFFVYTKKTVNTKKTVYTKKQNKQNKTISLFSPHPIISFAISLLETSHMAQIIVPQLPMILIQALSGRAGSISPLSFFPLVNDSRGGASLSSLALGDGRQQ
jgi:hypothetical protein